MYDTTICPLLFLGCSVGFLMLLLFGGFFREIFSILILLCAHAIYLHLCRTNSRCCSSLLRSCWVKHTFLALCVRVGSTLYLVALL